MTWNHRIVKQPCGGFALCEAHYENRGDTEPTSWTGPTTLEAESLIGMAWTLAAAAQALGRAVVDPEDPCSDRITDLLPDEVYNSLVTFIGAARALADVTREVGEASDDRKDEEG